MCDYYVSFQYECDWLDFSECFSFFLFFHLFLYCYVNAFTFLSLFFSISSPFSFSFLFTFYFINDSLIFLFWTLSSYIVSITKKDGVTTFSAGCDTHVHMWNVTQPSTSVQKIGKHVWWWYIHILTYINAHTYMYSYIHTYIHTYIYIIAWIHEYINA